MLIQINRISLLRKEWNLDIGGVGKHAIMLGMAIKAPTFFGKVENRYRDRSKPSVVDAGGSGGCSTGVERHAISLSNWRTDAGLDPKVSKSLDWASLVEFCDDGSCHSKW